MTVPLSIIATAPDRIWLDVGEISPLLDEGTRFQDLADVTWSEDNATGHGIRYERDDRADCVYAAVNALLAHIGAEGEISAHHTLVHDAMSALKAVDGGVFKPELAAPAEPAELHEDLRTLGKWLNEGIVSPIDRPALARVLHFASTHSAPVVQGEAVACACGDIYAADSYGAGYIDASGRCPNCDATPPAARTAEPVVNRATVIEWLDALDIEVTDRQIAGLFHAATPQAPTQGEDAARLASDGPVKALRSALGAMLTQFGMDEDEWSKPTFNQARAALAVQSAPEGDYEMMELVRHAFNKLPRYSFHLVEGGVRRVPDRYGAWVEWQAGHELFDAEVWDGLRRAAQAQGDKT